MTFGKCVGKEVVYTHDTWTGKGAFNKGIFWNRVSSSKLANDVLYIVLNY